MLSDGYQVFMELSVKNIIFEELYVAFFRLSVEIFMVMKFSKSISVGYGVISWKYLLTIRIFM